MQFDLSIIFPAEEVIVAFDGCKFEDHIGSKRNLYTCYFYIKGESTGVIGNVAILVLKLQIWMDLIGKCSLIQVTLVFQMDWLLIMGRRNSVGQTL